MENIEDGQWLTLAELAAARHISTASAARLVRRHEQWRRQRNNQGHVRVLVPMEALTADVREDILEDVRQQDSESVMAAVAGLIARAERAETEVDHHRERADAAEARAARVEQDQERANAVIASLEADLAAANARAKAAEASTEAAQIGQVEAQADAAELRQTADANRRAAEQRADAERARANKAERTAEMAAMTDLQWFAFVILPIGVTVFGALLAVVGVKLINHADRRKPAAE
jgi:hypothetical protein